MVPKPQNNLFAVTESRSWWMYCLLVCSGGSLQPSLVALQIGVCVCSGRGLDLIFERCTYQRLLSVWSSSILSLSFLLDIRLLGTRPAQTCFRRIMNKTEYRTATKAILLLTDKKIKTRCLLQTAGLLSPRGSKHVSHA